VAAATVFAGVAVLGARAGSVGRDGAGAGKLGIAEAELVSSTRAASGVTEASAGGDVGALAWTTLPTDGEGIGERASGRSHVLKPR
jgi:hypothetical protein